MKLEKLESLHEQLATDRVTVEKLVEEGRLPVTRLSGRTVLIPIGRQEEEETDEQLLTVVEVAQLLHMSIPSIYNYVRNGKIPVVRFDRTVRFNKKAIQEWLKSKTIPVKE